MKNFIRILCVALVIVMLLPTVVACAKDEEVSDETEEVATTVAVESGEEGPVPYMEDFNGYEFRVLSRGGGSGWVNSDIMGDYMGSTIDKAVAERNAIVTKKYNFTISEKQDVNFNDTAISTSMAGDDEFDMWSFMMRNMPQHGLSGYIWDLRNIEWLDIDASWYDQSVRETSTLADYLFFLTGDLLYIDDNSTGAMVFDHDRWNSLKCSEMFGGRDLYTIVKDGDWTFQTFKQVVVAGNPDTVGSTEAGDWGFMFDAPGLVLAWNVAMGNTSIIKDSNDLFVLNDSQKQIGDYQMIQEFFLSSNVTHTRAARTTFIMYCWLDMLNNGDGWPGYNFGVIPYPKRDTAQTQYRSFVTTYGAVGMAIPKTVKDVNKVASIMDLISYQSQKTVVPAYEEWLIAGNPAQRSEDIDMLRIVMDGQVIDPAHLWLETGVYHGLQPLLNWNLGEKKEVVSTLEGLRSTLNATTKDFLEQLKKLY